MPTPPLMGDSPDPASTIRGAASTPSAGSGLAAILDSSHDAIISKTLEGTITAWNRGAQRLFGYSAEEAIGRSITLIIPPELHPEEQEILARIRRGEEIEHFETQRITRDGRRLDVWLSVLAVRDAEGRITGAAKVARDITDRKRAEVALERRFAHLRILYDLTDSVSRASALEEVYDAALDGLEAALGAHRASILLHDDGGVMRFEASRGLSDSYRAAAEGHSPWTPQDRVFEPVFIRDARQADLGPLAEVIAREGIGALGFFPLVQQGRLLGKFMVYFDAAHDFTEEESRLGQAISRQIAFAIEQLRSEAVLYRREEAFRALAENSPDIIARFDRRFRHLYVNPAVVGATGLPQEHFLGRTSRELGMPAELCDRWEAALRATFEQGREQLLEFSYPGPDGTRHFSSRIVPEFGVDGAVETALGVTRDISENKQAEEAIRVSEERLRLATQTGKVGVWDWDVERDHVTWSESLYGVHGLEREQLVTTAEGFVELVHPEDRERVGDAIRRTLEEDTPYELEFRSLRPDGSLVWLFTNARVLRRDGRPVRMLGATMDITRLKSAEQAARESEQRFRMLADSAPVLIWMSGPAREGLYFNKVWLEFTGRTLEQERGDGWLRSIHPDDAEQAAATCRAAYEARRPFTMQLRMRRADGRWRWLLDTATPRFQPDGTLAGYIGSCLDITDRKQAEEERDHLLASERAARGDAERANRLKDEFLATVSHELRTPLNAIVGWSQLLARGGKDHDLDEGLQVIGRNTHALVRLVEDLLDVSRIISGKMRLDVQQVDLAEVIDAVVGSVEPAAAARGVHLERVIDSRVGLVTGDPARLQQIVWNLLSNAIKFTPRGGRVEALLERADSQVEIVVSDSGEGIDPELLPHLFERFRQADSSTTRRHGGLGIGLALVRHLTELHGGSVRADSAGKGTGATFTVAIPLRAIDTVDAGETRGDPEHRIRARAEGTELPVSLAGTSVLAIDDEPDTRALLQRCLEQAGARVTTAESAERGMSLLDEQRPDVLLCDIGMPGEDGYSFMRRVRELPPEEGGAVPAIALTAFARPEDRERALRAGFQLHLAKPVEPGELLGVISELVAGSRTVRGG